MSDIVIQSSIEHTAAGTVVGTMPNKKNRMTKNLRILLASGIVCLGLWLHCALSYGTGRGSDMYWGFIFYAIIGTPSYAIVFGVFLLIAKLVRKWMPGRVFFIVVVALFSADIAWTYLAHRPIKLFERSVFSPAPASLSNLKIRCCTSYSDPWIWGFQFTVDPDAFASICQQHGLRRFQAMNEQKRQAWIADYAADPRLSEKDRLSYIDSVFPEDREVRFAFGDDYQRPTKPEFFRAEGLVVVRNKPLPIA